MPQNKTVPRSLPELASLVDPVAWIGPAGGEITGVTDDSRAVEPGDLFVAVRGTGADGHAFSVEAARHGCHGILAEEPPGGAVRCPVLIVRNTREILWKVANWFYGNPAGRLRLVAVTGTNGKTTTSYLIRAILEECGRKVGLLGTIEYLTGIRTLPSSNTTPGVLELAELFSEMVSVGLDTVVMEVSSHALVQGRVEGISFAAAAFTNLTRDHLDYHKTMEEYREAKAILFRSLSSEAVAVLNTESDASAYYARQTRARVLLCGRDPSRPCWVSLARRTLADSDLELGLPGWRALVRTRLTGEHNAMNILLAAAASHALGADEGAVVRAIRSTGPVRGRLERVPSEAPYHVFVDYAHTDDALRNVLSALRSLVGQGRILLVFGCGGDRDRGKRPLMGSVAHELADYSIVTSDNPRSEEPESIVRDIQAGMPDRSRYAVVLERRDAIFAALEAAEPGDVVLIAGKGHEDYQLFADGKRPFDDRAVVREFFQERSPASCR